jgi:hypothetical protein
VEQDPFINFLSNLTEKIKVEKEHKALMEKINSNTEIPSVLPLEETLLNLQEKINQQVQAHLQEISPGVEPVILEGVIEQPQAIVEEKNFEDFVDKLKTILTSPRAEIPIVIAAVVEEEAPIEEEPVKEIEPIVNPYVQELQKQSVEKAPESNKYINDLDKLTTKVIAEKQPEKIEDVKKLIEEYVTKYARRILDLGGGGGSVAQQFANGGTMNGTLNVTGQYLSGGIDIVSIIANNLNTGNIAFSGNEIYTTNNNDIIINNNIIPTTSNTFNIGSSAIPFKTLFISASTLSMTAPFGGNTLSIINDGSNFNITNGGLRSTIIYTGGLLLSGNNIGADPAIDLLPMTIGTGGLPAVNFLAPLSAQSNTYLNSITATKALIGKSFSNFTDISTVTNTTAVSADFSKDTLIHLHAYKNGTINSVSSPLKIVPINFTAGSTVDILIFNPLPSNGVVYMDWGGVNATFPNYQNTNGAPYIVALSSISTTQTYHFRYICIDGTLTNTFITI